MESSYRKTASPIAMSYCLKRNIKIYPVEVQWGVYVIEINDNGYIFRLKERYKSKPRYKKDKVWWNEIYKLYIIINIMEKNKKFKSILEEASAVIHDRDSQKALEYGDFHESMAKAARIMSELTGKQITTSDFYKGMMALKLARLAYSDKYDTYLDLVAYISSASELINDNPHINLKNG